MSIRALVCPTFKMRTSKIVWLASLWLIAATPACKEAANTGAETEATAGGSATATPGAESTGGASATTTGNNATTGGDANTTAPVQGVTEQIHFAGRFVEDANSNKVFSWSGSQISAQFQGTAISIALDELNNLSSLGPNMYDVSIDGKASTSLSATARGGTYTLASGLASGLHTVSITKRTEASIGPARFRGFTVTGGSLVDKVYTVSRRILMIGDSITCGYGVLGSSSSCSFTTATENATLTYGALAAKNFNAELQITAWSGKGIYRNNDGTTDVTMSDLYTLAEPINSTQTYDWTQFVPDAIVVNLGTNDFSASLGEPSQSTFAATYLKMLTTLNTAYPKAHVFLMAGPMIVDNYPVGTSYLTDLKSYLNTIASSAPNAKTTVVNLTPLTDAQKGCDSHPNQSAQASMAQALQSAMSGALGW